MKKSIFILISLMLILMLAAFSVSDSITITDVKNNPESIVKPSNSEFPFYFDKVEHEDYDMLLNDYIIPGMNSMWGKTWLEDDTWTKAVKLRIWTKNFLDAGGWVEGNKWVSEYKKDFYTIPETLNHRYKGLDGYCSYYATFYMYSSLALGINNRRVGWWQPDGGGDQLNEVYIPEWGKWVAVSPLFNAWYSDRDGNALNLIELNQYTHANKLEDVITHRDGQTTYPDPEIEKKNWLAYYSWDIYIHSRDGYLFNPPFQAYRYENPFTKNYEKLNLNMISKSTKDMEILNFDASLIKITPTVKNSSVLISIDDYSVVNFKEFVWEIRNSDGESVDNGTFLPKEKEIDFKEINDGSYDLSLYAINTRLGKSNTVSISIVKE